VYFLAFASQTAIELEKKKEDLSHYIIGHMTYTVLVEVNPWGMKHNKVMGPKSHSYKVHAHRE
jgi:hypothetical protein